MLEFVQLSLDCSEFKKRFSLKICFCMIKQNFGPGHFYPVTYLIICSIATDSGLSISPNPFPNNRILFG